MYGVQVAKSCCCDGRSHYYAHSFVSVADLVCFNCANFIFVMSWANNTIRFAE